MTKKHFIALADVMRELKPPVADGQLGAFYQWIDTVDKIEAFCRESSPAFNAKRWRAYIDGECGPNGGKV